MRRLWMVALLSLLLSAAAFAQQDYVGRFEGYGGFSYLNAPDIGLGQWGFNTQAGVNVNRWLAFGFDYSIQTGSANLLPSEIKPSIVGTIQTGLGSPLPPGFYVPFDATTQTFAGGPQLEYRHFKRFTLFIHPTIGAIHESITLKADNGPFGPLQAGLLAALPELGIAKSPNLSDTTYFYGFGGGADLNAFKHLHFKCDLEYVHTFLFSGLLADPRNGIRVSAGPVVTFGGNVAK